LKHSQLQAREGELRRVRVDEMDRRDIWERRESGRSAAAGRDHAHAAPLTGTLDHEAVDARVFADLRERDRKHRCFRDPS
jgi:hypothetical protein